MWKAHFNGRGDAVALYPSMDPLGTAEMVFESVLESNILFKNIEFKWLITYIYLVLGEEIFHDHEMSQYIPKRVLKKGKKVSKAKSLAANVNREPSNWIVRTEGLSEGMKKLLVAILVKTLLIVLMDSTCYTFGGELYKQLHGAGIGLRSSACAAKLVMGKLDKKWASMQRLWGLSVQLYIRYIDDLRIYLRPIAKGWRWLEGGWVFDASFDDTRNPQERTCQEIAKSLNDTMSFLTFTAESEDDFNNGFLPTLDAQTKVMDNGEIMFKFFMKPMCNNIMIQYGTALPKDTIFASLRQDLVRRMLNTMSVPWDERLVIVEDFIQLLRNSGHSFTFIKAITLQALTKYQTMVERSKLDEGHKKFIPLYRPRSFRELDRKLAKHVGSLHWFKGLELYDPYRNDWKRKLNKTTRERGSSDCIQEKINKPVTNVMFVPHSYKSWLVEKIREAERTTLSSSKWRIKVLEQSGIPLTLAFVPKFPITIGCPRGLTCGICKDNNGIRCSKKSVVYRSWCKKCELIGKSVNYVGETSRPFRERVIEHYNKRNNWKNDSYQLIHWMEEHGMDGSCPEFGFEIMYTYKDPLRHQVCEGLNILKSGQMNKRMEFNHNFICRMNVTEDASAGEEYLKKGLRDKLIFKECVRGFIAVMEFVHSCDLNKDNDCDKNIQVCEDVPNDLNISRYNTLKNQIVRGGAKKRKREFIKMETSTPKLLRREHQELNLSDDSPINSRSELGEGSTVETSCGSNETGHNNNTAGISGDLDRNCLTPYKQLSDSKEEQKLYKGAANLATAASASGLVDVATVNFLTNESDVLRENWFSNGYVLARSGSMKAMFKMGWKHLTSPHGRQKREMKIRFLVMKLQIIN